MSRPEPPSKTRMRILHTEASCGWGGQEIRVLEEACGLIGRGHDVHLACPADSSIYQAATRYGVPAHALPIGRKNLEGLFALRGWLKHHPFDILNSHSSTDSWLAALACHSFGQAPLIVRTRHLSTPVHANRPTFWLYQRACRHVVVTGEALKDQLVRDNGFDPASLTSVPTGIDLQRFHPRDRLASRASLGLPPDATLLGILATLRDWKGHTVLFEAIDQLRERFPALRILVVGDGPYRDRLDTHLEKLGLADRVDFVGHRDDPEIWLAAMDLFVLPSWGDEGVSQALMQAMATGLPIITTPVGSLGEVIKDGVTGLMVPPRDPHALAGAIVRLLDNVPLAARLGDTAQALATQCCGRERMLDKMESIFSRYATQREA